VKFHNQITKLLKAGDIDKFDELQELWEQALSAGNRENIGIKLGDNIGEVLSEEYETDPRELLAELMEEESK
jgi:hypothetical protein